MSRKSKGTTDPVYENRNGQIVLRDTGLPGTNFGQRVYELRCKQPLPIWPESMNSKTLWIYDFRTNQHFTLKTQPLKRADLDDFVSCYNRDNRHERKASERFRPFEYHELAKRDKASLDIFWLKDDSPEDSANLPDPDTIALEIAEDLEAALDQFSQIAADVKSVECQ